VARTTLRGGVPRAPRERHGGQVLRRVDHHPEDGEYRCRACGTVLFEAETKYESGCGWPAFYAAEEESVTTTTDTSHGMRRTEVRCANCDSHLGHVFDDGPEPTGKRFCINSVAMKYNEE